MSELAPRSAFPEALLLSQPVIFSSTKPPFAALTRTSFIVISLVPAFLRISRWAVAPRMPPREGRDDVPLRGPVGGPLPVEGPVPVFLLTAPRPLIETPMTTSPSRSVLARRCAAGARGAAALEVLWRDTMFAAVGIVVNPVKVLEVVAIEKLAAPLALGVRLFVVVSA